MTTLQISSLTEALDIPARWVLAGIEALRPREPTSARFSDSFGDRLSDIDNRSRWVLVGSACSLWHKEILPLIDELLRENTAKIYKGWGVGDDATIRHCWMIGYNKACSRPTVVICCNIKGILKRSMRVILRDGRLKKGGFELMGLTTGDLKLATMTQGHGVRLTSTAEADALGTPRNLCGASIVVDGSSRRATIGGVIIIDGKYYGLTVAHALTDGNTIDVGPEILKTDLQFLDSSWADESSSDDDSDSLETSTQMERDYCNHQPPTSSFTKDIAIIQDSHEDQHLYIWAISSRNPFKDTEDSVFDGFDWALIELTEDRYHGMNEVPLLETAETSPKSLFLRNFKTSAPYGKVLVATGSGVVCGIGTGSTCSIKFKNSSVYRNVWSVELDRRLVLGDSGSWVVDASTGDIYGTLVARCDSLLEGYVIPATEIIENIISVTQAVDVTLPTIEGALCLASRYGNEPLVRRILATNASAKVDFGTGGKGGDGILSKRTPYGFKTVQPLVKTIIKKDVPRETALHIAIRYGHESVAKLLLENGADLDSKGGICDWTPLFMAADGGLKAVMKLLIEKGAALDSMDSSGRTPLSLAAKRGHEAVAKLLLEKGAALDFKDGVGQTPLSLAAGRGYEAVVKLLLDKGAALDSKDRLGRTPLSWAAENGHEAVVKLLLEKWDALDSKDSSGRTPLSWAAEKDHEAAVKLLLEMWADLDSKDSSGRTPLSWAAENGHEAVVKLLLKKWADLDSKDSSGRTLLSWAAERGHEAAVKLLLEKGADLDSKDSSGRTPLSWAAGGGHEAVAKLLLEKGAVMDPEDRSGWTPLSWAAQKGHGAVAKLLLDKGAALDPKGRFGLTPLSWAAIEGYEAVVKLLLDKGAALDPKDRFGQTPLSWAAKEGHEAVVKLLLDKGAALDSKDSLGQTPLTWATEGGHEAVVKLLLEKVAALDSRDGLGRTPLLRISDPKGKSSVELPVGYWGAPQGILRREDERKRWPFGEGTVMQYEGPSPYQHQISYHPQSSQPSYQQQPYQQQSYQQPSYQPQPYQPQSYQQPPYLPQPYQQQPYQQPSYQSQQCQPQPYQQPPSSYRQPSPQQPSYQQQLYQHQQDPPPSQ